MSRQKEAVTTKVQFDQTGRGLRITTSTEMRLGIVTGDQLGAVTSARNRLVPVAVSIADVDNVRPEEIERLASDSSLRDRTLRDLEELAQTEFAGDPTAGVLRRAARGIRNLTEDPLQTGF